MPAKKKLRKNPAEKIVVKSKAYGVHERAPRGSKSKAVLNKAMKAHGKRLRESTAPAKLIMDALQPFRENFKGGMIWQRLVKHFASQAKNGEAYSVAGIANWDFNTAYLTSRIMGVSDDIKPDDEFSILKVNLNYTLSKRFLERKSDITAFRITLIFLFPDFKNNRIKTIPFVLPDKLLSDNSLYSFIVDIPRRANSYLCCFKAEACSNGEIQQNTKNVGIAMCLIASGTREIE
ncbi:MAG TPA: hypothetical protein VK772_05490 [Puia sp.]|nr:hypothetical protein [Puia sp.]